MLKKISIFILSFFFIAIAKAERIAVIGGGCSGLLSAWLIEPVHQMTIFEARNRLGGHANTIVVNVDGKPVNIEAGVDFFNEGNYPNFVNLLRFLNISLRPFKLIVTFYTTDGEKVLILPPFHDGITEWKSLIPANWLKILQLKVVMDRGKKIVEKNDYMTTLSEAASGLSDSFQEETLYPLLASGWGVSPEAVKQFSAYNTIKYLLDSYAGGFIWYQVENGITTYIQKLASQLKNTEVKLSEKVLQVINNNNKSYTIVTDKGRYENFDEVIFATEPKVTMRLLKGMNKNQKLVDAISKITDIYAKVAIHGDPRFMPPNPKDWRVANVRYDGKNSQLTIYKNWLSTTPIFKSWINLDVRSPDDHGSPLPSPAYAIYDYVHSYVDKPYFEVQPIAQASQGIDHLWYAGLWTNGRDIHESAVISAKNITLKLAPHSYRLIAFGQITEPRS